MSQSLFCLDLAGTGLTLTPCNHDATWSTKVGPNSPLVLHYRSVPGTRRPLPTMVTCNQCSDKQKLKHLSTNRRKNDKPAPRAEATAQPQDLTAPGPSRDGHVLTATEVWVLGSKLTKPLRSVFSLHGKHSVFKGVMSVSLECQRSACTLSDWNNARQ